MDNYLQALILVNEAMINEQIFDVYSLCDSDREMVLDVEGGCIGALPLSSEAKECYLQEFAQDSSNFSKHTHEYVNNIPTRSFTDDEVELIRSNFTTLYQKNNDIESFCKKHQINPINLWYWFKQISIIPNQRMEELSLEFLVDLVREILAEDEDGIIPLVPNSGEKVLLERIETKFQGKGFSTSQYSSFDSFLGLPIQEFVFNKFFKEFSEHLNLFPNIAKTPYIWHLTSGSERGFDCYVSIYKWSRDNLMRIRSVYIEHRERALVNRQSDLANNESVDAQNEKDKIFKQLKEIEAFKVKIDELLEEGYDPILDDGVGKNIAPLQKKKMLAYDVLNAGQLKKYLNADW